MALVECQQLLAVSSVKDSWQQAMDSASKILKPPEKFIVHYNPAIWRGSRYTVGIRLLSDPWSHHLIFEFATPNFALPGDCFSSDKAKMGVMLHEFAHLIDDQRWGFDLRGLRTEAGDYVTREQRAELLAFACDPLAVLEANSALVQSTARMLGIDLAGHVSAWAAAETAGHAGLVRKRDPIPFFRGIQEQGVAADRILEAYLCTFVFALAGLVVVPEQNQMQGLGIKRSGDLARASEGLCRHLRGQMSPEELERLLEEVGYYGFSGEGYDPLSCLDFACVDLQAATDNLELASDYFLKEETFSDLRLAAEKIRTKIGNLPLGDFNNLDGNN